MFRVSGRARKILVGVLAAAVALGGVFLAVLPDVVRRVAIDQVPKLTKRTLLLDDVDLNLFTGHLALKGVKVIRHGSTERAYEIERVDVRVDYLPLFLRHVRLTEITVAAAKLQVLRHGPMEFDFSDLLDLFKGGEPSKEPSKWMVTLEKVALQRSAVVGRDRTTSPESVWRIDDVNLAANGLMIGPGARPGRLELSFKLNDAPITVASDSLILVPLAAKARATVEGFDLAPVHVYLPPSVPAAPRAGRVTLALAAAVELGPAGIKSGNVKGKVATTGVEVFQTGRTEPFLKIPRLDVEIKDADLAARSVTIASLAIEGLSGRAVRDAQERIDLVAMAGPREPAQGAAPPVSPAATPAAARVRSTVAGGRRHASRLQGEGRADHLASGGARAQGRGRQAAHDAHGDRPVGGREGHQLARHRPGHLRRLDEDAEVGTRRAEGRGHGASLRHRVRELAARRVDRAVPAVHAGEGALRGLLQRRQ